MWARGGEGRTDAGGMFANGSVVATLEILAHMADANQMQRFCRWKVTLCCSVAGRRLREKIFKTCFQACCAVGKIYERFDSSFRKSVVGNYIFQLSKNEFSLCAFKGVPLE